MSRCQAWWKRGCLLIGLPAQVVQHCCATLAPLQTVRLYAGISSPVGYRAMLRHFAILAGLASAVQSERSRFNTAAGEQSPIITAPVLGSRTAETTSGKGSVVLPMTRAKLTGGVSHLVLRHYTYLKNSSYHPLGMSAALLSAHDHDTRLVMSKRCKLHRLKKRRTN